MNATKYISDNYSIFNILINNILGAKSSVTICHNDIDFVFFSSIFDYSIRKGVVLKIIVTKSSYKKYFDLIKSRGLVSNVFILDQHHHKFIIIDDRIILYGSVNLFPRSMLRDEEYLFETNDLSLIGNLLSIISESYQISSLAFVRISLKSVINKHKTRFYLTLILIIVIILVCI